MKKWWYWKLAFFVSFWLMMKYRRKFLQTSTETLENYRHLILLLRGCYNRTHREDFRNKYRNLVFWQPPFLKSSFIILSQVDMLFLSRCCLHNIADFAQEYSHWSRGRDDKINNQWKYSLYDDVLSTVICFSRNKMAASDQFRKELFKKGGCQKN